MQELVKNGFFDVDIYEIKRSLRELTNEIVSSSENYHKADIQKADLLLKKHKQIIDSGLYIIDKIY